MIKNQIPQNLKECIIYIDNFVDLKYLGLNLNYCWIKRINYEYDCGAVLRKDWELTNKIPQFFKDLHINDPMKISELAICAFFDYCKGNLPLYYWDEQKFLNEFLIKSIIE